MAMEAGHGQMRCLASECRPRRANEADNQKNGAQKKRESALWRFPRELDLHLARDGSLR